MKVVVAAAVVTVEAFLVVLDPVAAAVMMTQMIAVLPPHLRPPVVLAHLPNAEVKSQQKMLISRLKQKMTMIKSKVAGLKCKRCDHHHHLQKVE